MHKSATRAYRTKKLRSYGDTNRRADKRKKESIGSYNYTSVFLAQGSVNIHELVRSLIKCHNLEIRKNLNTSTVANINFCKNVVNKVFFLSRKMIVKSALQRILRSIFSLPNVCAQMSGFVVLCSVFITIKFLVVVIEKAGLITTSIIMRK